MLIILNYIVWYEFLNDLDALKNFVTKKADQVELFLS